LETWFKEYTQDRCPTSCSPIWHKLKSLWRSYCMTESAQSCGNLKWLNEGTYIKYPSPCARAATDYLLFSSFFSVLSSVHWRTWQAWRESGRHSRWILSSVHQGTPFRPVMFSMYCRYCRRGRPLFRFPSNNMEGEKDDGLIIYIYTLRYF